MASKLALGGALKSRDPSNEMILPIQCRSISPHLLKIKVFRIVRKIEKTNSNWANFTSKNGRGFESRLGFSLFHLTEYAIADKHTLPVKS